MVRISEEFLSSHKKNNVFVETGTNFGYTLERALAVGYEKAISIECNDQFYNMCRRKFDGDDRVALHLGDSATDLHLMIAGVDEPMDFWLDAHITGGDPGIPAHEYPGEGRVPILQELEQVLNHPNKDHLIIIDDIDLLADPSSGMGGEETTMDNLITFIKERHSNCCFEYDAGRRILFCDMSSIGDE